MADTFNNSEIISVIATNASRISDLPIVNSQLIFIQDAATIAFDFNGNRVFYNQIKELSTENDRLNLTDPINGRYYFVVDKAVLWYYKDKWIQVTHEPEECICIDVVLPKLGSARTLYVNKKELNIAVWDEEIGNYVIVSDTTEPISDSTIDDIFNQH